MSLYQPVKGGTNTNALTVKPQADDINVIQFEIRSSCTLLKCLTCCSMNQLQLQTIKVTLHGQTRTLGPVLLQGIVSAAFMRYYLQEPLLGLNNWNPSRRFSFQIQECV